MSLKIDRVQLQFEIKPDYQQQELRRLEEDLKKANRALSQTEREIERVRKAKPNSGAANFFAKKFGGFGESLYLCNVKIQYAV